MPASALLGSSKAMPIQFECDSCGTGVKVPDGSEGRKVKCPRCNTMLLVPRAEPVVAQMPTQAPQLETDQSPGNEQEDPLAALAAAAETRQPMPAPAPAPETPTPKLKPVVAPPTASPDAKAPARPTPSRQPQAATTRSKDRSDSTVSSPTQVRRPTVRSEVVEGKSDTSPNPAPVSGAPGYIGLLVVGWILRVVALLCLVGSVVWTVVGSQGAASAFMTLVAGLCSAVLVGAIGESIGALRDIARNSFRR